MNGRVKIRVQIAKVLAILLAVALPISAQAPAAAASRFLGTITGVNGTTLTVKTDAGDVHQVDVPSTAALKQVEPGAKDLSAAQTIEFNSLTTGDRVLVRLDPNAPAGASVALQVIAIKQADLAKKQEAEREAWQQNGVGGLVKSVDPTAGAIVITSGAGAAAKTITIHTDKNTVLKRYAPASVRYDLAKPEPIDAVKAGDQLRARGQKSEGGTEIAAEEIVSGSFRNISGTVTSLDTAGSSLVVKDLASKKQVTIKIDADTQMRQLPEAMATRLANVLNGNNARGGGPGGAGRAQGGGQGGSQGGGQNGGPGSSGPPAGGAQGPGGPGQGPGGGQHVGFVGGGGFDAQQMLSRAPAIKLSDLKKGDAVMVVATDDPSGMSAITLMAGVEPLLQAPAASQNLLNWSLSSGAPDAGQ